MTQMGLTDIFRTLYPNTKDYNIFSTLHGPSIKLKTYSVTKQISTNTQKCDKLLYLTESLWLKGRIEQQTIKEGL